MRRNSVLRFVYGLGLIVAAVGFVMPMIDLVIFGTFNGFQIADFIGSMAGNVPRICLYALFCLCCVGGLLAFVPKASKIDALIFLLIVIDVGGLVYMFVGGNSGGDTGLMDLFGDSLKEIILNLLQPGAWMFLGGFVVAIISCILRPFVRGKK